MAGGRPLKLKTEDFTETVLNYLAETELPTKSGLLLALGISRETWREYKERPEFVDAIKEAELCIEEAWVQRLKGQAVAGPIFYLKNAFKEEYRERTDITTDGKALPTPILGAATKEDEV